MRRAVIAALASLSDTDYQERVWLNRIYPHAGYYDDFAANVHVLYDDARVLPDPDSCLHSILLPGDEVGRLRNLDVVLGGMLDDKAGATDAAYMADPRWSAVNALSALALAAMVLAGGFGD